MNIMQFWVIDTFIKHKTTEKSGPTIRLNRDEEDAEALLRRHQDEEEDVEQLGPPPHYTIHDTDEDHEDEEVEDSFISVHHPSEFLQASSSSNINNDTSINIRGNEYELDQKKH
jgi:hypothetical protein